MAPALTNLSMLLVACMLLCFQCLFTHTTAFFTSISSTGRGYLSRRHLKSGFSGGGIHASTVTPTKKPSAPGKIKVPKENPGELFKTSISKDFFLSVRALVSVFPLFFLCFFSSPFSFHRSWIASTSSNPFPVCI